MPDYYDEEADDCYDDVECSSCGHEYDSDEHSTCPECGSSQRDGAASTYSTNVLRAASFDWSIACRSNTDRIRMGYELEMTAPTARPSAAARDPLNQAFTKLRDEMPFANKYCITKSDASIQGPNPAELCTIPLTVSEHSRVLYRAFPEGRIGGNRLRMWSNSSCGMHIHIGLYTGQTTMGRTPPRQASALSIGKLMVFINEPRNEMFWVDMCGRGANSYASFRRTHVTDYSRINKGTQHRTIHGRPHHIPNLQRYEALNLTNGTTMEFRLPRPTARIPSVLKNLELFESALRWVKDRAACDAFFYEDYLRWLAAPDRRKTYTYLHNWLFRKQTSLGTKYRSYI